MNDEWNRRLSSARIRGLIYRVEALDGPLWVEKSPAGEPYLFVRDDPPRPIAHIEALHYVGVSDRIVGEMKRDLMAQGYEPEVRSQPGHHVARAWRGNAMHAGASAPTEPEALIGLWLFVAKEEADPS